MANVFRYDDQHVEKPNRNAYSKTFSSAVSARFGELIPVFCQPVMNGETVKIKHKHNFNFMPIVFPVQTRVRASLQYFYVRNRNVWKDWMDFQFKMKPNLVPPYLKFNREMRIRMLQVGGFLDNIGCPVTVLENIGRDIQVEPLPFDTNNSYRWFNPYITQYMSDDTYLDFANTTFTELTTSGVALQYVNFNDVVTGVGLPSGVQFIFHQYRYPVKPTTTGTLSIRIPGAPYGPNFILVKAVRPVSDVEYTERDSTVTTRANRRTYGGTRPDPQPNSDSQGRTIGGSVDRTTTEQTVSTQSLGEETGYFIISVPIVESSQRLNLPDIPGWKNKEILGYYQLATQNPYEAAIVSAFVDPSKYQLEGGIHLADVALIDLPYANTVSDTEDHLRVSSMPNRHFESIYNAWYRNSENNPFKINGVVEYNKFLENTEGGAETFNFPRRFANWQDDAFTTALHSPQHGDAPLVGLVNQFDVSQGGFIVTFANDDGTKNRVRFKKSASTDNVVVVAADSTQNGLNVPSTPSDGYVGQLQEAMIEATRFGININDFRNVNSFQRWLENNVRKGYKYRDQIKSHYGVSVRYDTLDMPEYLGGTSRDMNVTQVTQTTENENGVLGDYAGNAWIEGESEHEIEHYCDEEGYIIGILHIMPSASYSQLIPKHLLRQNAFDYYSPEFGKIGMQPILNREVAPIASFYKGTGGEVFGYQRAWYDYLDNVDSLHGKFRTQFRNFLINRVFDDVPTLSEDFLVYDPDQVNNIFYVDDNEDKIIGQILFDYKSLLPIPLYGIPALE